MFIHTILLVYGWHGKLSTVRYMAYTVECGAWWLHTHQEWRIRGAGGAQAPPNLKVEGLSSLTFPLGAPHCIVVSLFVHATLLYTDSHE